MVSPPAALEAKGLPPGPESFPSGLLNGFMLTLLSHQNVLPSLRHPYFGHGGTFCLSGFVAILRAAPFKVLAHG